MIPPYDFSFLLAKSPIKERFRSENVFTSQISASLSMSRQVSFRSNYHCSGFLSPFFYLFNIKMHSFLEKEKKKKGTLDMAALADKE